MVVDLPPLYVVPPVPLFLPPPFCVKIILKRSKTKYIFIVTRINENKNNNL
jgi:hypothetical protein